MSALVYSMAEARARRAKAEQEAEDRIIRESYAGPKARARRPLDEIMGYPPQDGAA